MSVIKFSTKDFLRAKIVTPSNYLVNIISVKESMSKDGQSKNYIIDDAEIIRDADSGDTEFAGVPTPWWSFNSKRPEFMIPFYAALGVNLQENPNVEWKAVEGHKIVVFIGNKELDGRLGNEVKGSYRAAPVE